MSIFSTRLAWGLAAVLAAGVLSVSDVQAQSPVTSILNGGSDTALEVTYSGGLFAPGKFADLSNYSAPNDSIPAEGAGVRMMWYPEKAAFRAGRVGGNKDGTQWDASEVGPYSAAFGVDTKASGFNAMAVGSATTARGISAAAMGEGSVAATPRSLSIGECNSANSGPSRDQTLFAVGNGAFDNGNCRRRSDALVLKRDGGLVASGSEGSGSIPTTGAGTRMMWYPAEAAFRAGQVGAVSGREDVWDPDSVGSHSVAFGRDTRASDFAATAFGDGTVASGEEALAMGGLTEASGDRATAMGLSTTASGEEATAMGASTTASGFNTVAMGLKTIAATGNSLSIGEYNSANTSDDGTLFVVGGGTPSVRSDALVLDTNGNLTISGSLTQNSDRRLKTAIQPLEGEVLPKLTGLRPVRYEFKNDTTHPSGPQIGLIAQDVQTAFPELVSEGSRGYLSLDYPKLTAVLLKGLQQQQAQLDSLKGRVQRLEKQTREIDRLKARLSRMETRTDGSVLAGRSGPGLLLAVFLGGLLGAGLLWRRRASNVE